MTLRSSSVSLPHFSLTLPLTCFQLPSTRFQSISTLLLNSVACLDNRVVCELFPQDRQTCKERPDSRYHRRLIASVVYPSEFRPRRHDITLSKQCLSHARSNSPKQEQNEQDHHNEPEAA